jgi:hypothetical protein
MDLTDAQIAGHACISCGKPGEVADGQQVGTVDGVEVWACHGGCVFIASMGQQS